MSNKRGVIYVATGEKYVEMTAKSSKSLKTHSPDLPVHIFTDCDVSSYKCFNSSTKISDPHRSYGAKLDYFRKTPFQKTLYLDCDTRVCEDIVPIFDLLDRYEFAIAHDFGRGKHIGKYTGQSPHGKGNNKKFFTSQIPISFPPMNGGVILYKWTDSVIKFFKAWEEAFYKEGLDNDQLTLRDQLWLCDLNMWILPPEYNCRPKEHIKALMSERVTPKILHLNDFKREAGIPPIDSLPLRKKIKYIFKHRIMPEIRSRLIGYPY